MIDVLLVDDQTLVRRGIRSLLDLSADIRVVAEADDGRAAVTLARALRPAVMLLDVRMPQQGGIETLAELTSTGDLPPTILLTTFDDDVALLAGIRGGARGYLLKDVTLEVLADGIRTVAAGGSLHRPAISDRVLKGLARAPMDFERVDLGESLTPREVDVLRLMAGGYSNREIADALGMVEGTVKNHASSILSKLGVRDRTRAVLLALERGLI